MAPVFQRAYTARALERAEGFAFHPITGEPIATLVFSQHGYKFTRHVQQIGGWLTAYDVDVVPLPQIGGGKKRYETGEAFPRRWRFNPFTGNQLIQLSERQ